MPGLISWRLARNINRAILIFGILLLTGILNSIMGWSMTYELLGLPLSTVLIAGLVFVAWTHFKVI